MRVGDEMKKNSVLRICESRGRESGVALAEIALASALILIPLITIFGVIKPRLDSSDSRAKSVGAFLGLQFHPVIAGVEDMTGLRRVSDDETANLSQLRALSKTAARVSEEEICAALVSRARGERGVTVHQSVTNSGREGCLASFASLPASAQSELLALADQELRQHNLSSFVVMLRKRAEDVSGANYTATTPFGVSPVQYAMEIGPTAADEEVVIPTSVSFASDPINPDANVFMRTISATATTLHIGIYIRNMSGIYGMGYRVNFNNALVSVHSFVLEAWLKLGGRCGPMTLSGPNADGDNVLTATFMRGCIPDNPQEKPECYDPAAVAGDAAQLAYTFVVDALNVGDSRLEFSGGKFYTAECSGWQNPPANWVSGTVTAR